MTVHHHARKAVLEAQTDAKLKGVPHAVVLWKGKYHVRNLARAQHLVAAHPEATIMSEFYPEDGAA